MSLLQNIEEYLQEHNFEVLNIEQFAVEYPRTYHIKTDTCDARIFLRSKKKLKNKKVFQRETKKDVWSFSFKSKNSSCTVVSPKGLRLTLNQIISSLKDTEKRFKELENYKNMNYKLITYEELLKKLNK